MKNLLQLFTLMLALLCIVSVVMQAQTAAPAAVRVTAVVRDLSNLRAPVTLSAPLPAPAALHAPDPAATFYTMPDSSHCSFDFTYTHEGNGVILTNTSQINGYIDLVSFGTNLPFAPGQAWVVVYGEDGYYDVCMHDALDACPPVCHNIYFGQDSIPPCNLTFTDMQQGNTVYFTNTSAAVAALSFGDNTAQHYFYPNQTIAHTYTTSGYYTACINDSLGVCPPVCDSFYIAPSYSCNLSFTYTQQDNIVYFTNTSALSYYLDFTDSTGLRLVYPNQTIAHTYATSGNYTVCMYDSAGVCPSLCDSITVLPIVTAVETATPDLATQIALFPNPTRNQQFSIRYDGFGSENKIERLRIYNAIGQLVHDETLNATNTATVHTPNLASGVYMVEIQTDNGKCMKKLMME